MADVKISGLPASTVPLAGTEVLPIVQSGATKQVSIANVTAGRAIAALSITTDTYKAASSAGGTLQANNATACLQWGAGGGSGLIFDGGVSSTAANAAIVFSPTGTGTVAISPAGALTVNPTTASTINNASIGVTTPLAGKFTTLEATGKTKSAGGFYSLVGSVALVVGTPSLIITATEGTYLVSATFGGNNPNAWSAWAVVVVGNSAAVVATQSSIQMSVTVSGMGIYLATTDTNGTYTWAAVRIPPN